jgi:fructose-bisphosphate aldolase class II
MDKDMVSYKSLGLVNSVELFKKAMAGKYAIPAYNFNNMEQLQAIIQACVETESPVILQVSKGAREYANQTLLRYMAQGAVEYAKEISGGRVFRLFCTWIMVRILKPARAASIWASPLS